MLELELQDPLEKPWTFELYRRGELLRNPILRSDIGPRMRVRIENLVPGEYELAGMEQDDPNRSLIQRGILAAAGSPSLQILVPSLAADLVVRLVAGPGTEDGRLIPLPFEFQPSQDLEIPRAAAAGTSFRIGGLREEQEYSVLPRCDGEGPFVGGLKIEGANDQLAFRKKPGAMSVEVILAKSPSGIAGRVEGDLQSFDNVLAIAYPEGDTASLIRWQTQQVKPNGNFPPICSFQGKWFAFAIAAKDALRLHETGVLEYLAKRGSSVEVRQGEISNVVIPLIRF
jgi:hypothetical protein